MRPHSSILGWLILVLAPCLLGNLIQCGFKVPIPDGFAEVPAGNDHFRARSPQLGHYRVNIHTNPRGGTDKFWQVELERVLKESYGYKIISSKVGIEGFNSKLIVGTFEAEADEQGVPFFYYICYVIDGDTLYIHDYGAAKAVAADEMEAVKVAIKKFHD